MMIGGDAKIGDFVYKPYRPQKPGKIISMSAPNKYNSRLADVKWLDGKISQHQTYSLESFIGLINDHKKKLKTHTSKLPALRKL